MATPASRNEYFMPVRQLASLEVCTKIAGGPAGPGRFEHAILKRVECNWFLQLYVNKAMAARTNKV